MNKITLHTSRLGYIAMALAAGCIPAMFFITDKESIFKDVPTLAIFVVFLAAAFMCLMFSIATCDRYEFSEDGITLISRFGRKRKKYIWNDIDDALVCFLDLGHFKNLDIIVFYLKKHKNMRLPFQKKVVLKFTNVCEPRDKNSAWEKNITKETIDKIVAILKSKVKVEEQVSFTYHH